MDRESIDTVQRRIHSQFKEAGHQDLDQLPAMLEAWKTRAASAELPTLCVLAHEFGSLGDGAPQAAIDGKLRDFILLSLESLDRRVRDGKEITWDTVVETFNQSHFMQRDPNMSWERSKTFETDLRYGVNLPFAGRSNQDEDIVNDLEAWLKYELVSDSNIIAAMKVPMEKVSNIVARTGPICYKHIRLDNSRNGMDFIDVGIIRYPDFFNPFIQVYRICLTAWTSSKSKWGLLQVNRGGVNGRLTVRTYRPHMQSIEETLNNARDNAIRDFRAPPQKP